MATQKKATASYYIVLDTKPNKDNLVKVYIRFIQERRKREHFTGIRWQADRFDRINETLLPRYPKDPDVEMHNLQLRNMKSKLNKLSTEAYFRDISYTIEDYIKVLTDHPTLSDIAAFMRETIMDTARKGIISEETYKRHRSTLRKLQEYFGEVIPISQITVDRILEMDAYFRKQGRAKNTITSYHKVFRKYIRMAIDKGLVEKDPYEKIKYSYSPGNRVALTQDEVKRLYTIFMNNELDIVEHEVLRRFLFSCMTGIRISDTHRLTSDHIKGDRLQLTPYKTRKLGKNIDIPLPQRAKDLIKGISGKLFVHFEDQSINRILKRIAALADIDKPISYHCARDTFGTIFIELGGDVKSLSDLMGHSSIRITEIYLKMADKRKAQLMNNFDVMFES